ncbi:START domain-containing protein [Halobacteriovorax marinus]|uniref:START domain-containing protein n=1 Tax=Halobacteriovorax marinus TaxID=97084 RepID=UPI0002F30775|nr:START domain-containing protein [Halobacteriovorax marinus]
MKTLALFTFLLSFTTFANADFKEFFNPDGWEKIYTKSGVVVYSQKSKHSSLVGFRAEAILEAPLENILATLRDVEGTISWAPNMIEKSTLKEISDVKAITYSNNDLPWPAADRDMIQMNELRLDKEKKELIVDTYSVDYENYPVPKDVVRAHMTFGTLAFKRAQNNSSVQMTLLVDPRGSLPIWLVNMLQKRLPFQFLKALEAQSKISKAPLRPGIKVLLDQLDGLK